MGPRCTWLFLFERSEFLIATCKKKRTDRLSVCTQNLLVLVWKNCLGSSVGYQRAPGWFQFGKIEICLPAHAAVAQGVRPSDYEVEVREFDSSTRHLFFFFPLFFSPFFFSMGGGVLCMYFLFFCNTPPICDHHLQLGLCWAFTMHKSQGQTLDKAVIDLSLIHI